MSGTESCDVSPVVRKSRLNVLPSHPYAENPDGAVNPGRFPPWLHRKLPSSTDLAKTDGVINKHRLHTVCEEAKCPNRWECWSHNTATFLVMGRECTRACGFCDIATSKTPPPLDPEEPQRVADSVRELGLKHAVITMVARDDLPDGGAQHLVDIVAQVRAYCPQSTVELLVSDLGGSEEAWLTVLNSKPEVFNHNIETVRSLTPRVRHRATYDRTLQLLAFAGSHRILPKMLVKSGIMVGLGETEEEVFDTIRDLKEAGCNTITIGQYLQPNRRKLLVKAFVTPEQFERYASFGKSIGVQNMYCGPFVRSSYNAGLFL
ncbi:MAG: lipoyl synthase [Parachlamydiales bacterium]|jgi:lipoic acid synthetase